MQTRAKKLLSLLLVLTLILGLVPAAAAAAETAEAAQFIVKAEDCKAFGEYMYDAAYLYDGPVPEGAKEVTFGDFEAEGNTITSITATNTMLSDVNTAPLSDLFAYTAEDAADDDNLELSDEYADYAFENVLAYFVMDEDGNWATFFIVYEAEEEPIEYDRTFTVTVGDTVIPETDIDMKESAYTYTPYGGSPYDVDVYTVTVPAGTEKVLLTFTENRLAYNYTAAGEYLGGLYTGDTYMTGALTAEVPVDYGDDVTPADGEIDYIQVQTPYDAAWNSTVIYVITFRFAEAEAAQFIVKAEDCKAFGEYMYDAAYLYDGPVPEVAKEVTFGDFEAEGNTITSLTATNTMLTDVNTAPLSALFAYTAEDAADDDSLELSDEYADYAFENVLAYFVMDEDGNWATFFIVYEAEEAPIEYDRTFTVTVDGSVIPEADIALVEDGYSYTDYMTGKQAAVDAYVVTVPAGTEKVLLTFAENRLAYNYTAAGEYLGGYYEDFKVGALTAEVPLDYGDDATPADGEIDYIQVQTPYDDAWNSTLIYAITFKFAGGTAPGTDDPDQPGDSLTPEQVRDAIAARYAGNGCASDANAPWLTADMMAYLGTFPDTENKLSEEELQALTDKFIDALAKASSASDAAKSIIALASMGIDPTRLTTAEGESLNGREKLDALCFDGESLIGADGDWYYYSLPYIIIAYQQLEGAENALSALTDKAVELKASWLDTAWGTDGLTPFMLALAPYAEDNAGVKTALAEALAALKAAQGADGSLGSSAASTGLALAGLTAMGEDPAAITSAEGKSLVDGLMAFTAGTGDGFEPTANSYSTEQGFRGLIALANPAGYRIYDFRAGAVNPASASQRAVVFEVVPEEASVTVTDSRGNVVEPSAKNTYRDLAEGTYGYVVSLEGYEDKTGEFTVTAEAAAQVIRVSLTIEEAGEDDEDAVTVTVFVYAHDGDSCGNKLTFKNDGDKYYSILRGESYTARLTKGATARDALVAALEDSGLSYEEESNGYFSSIGGYEQATHGAKSGWMYLVNGESPVVAANGYVFDADAEMIWYFTDDYTGEYGSEEYADENGASAVLRPETKDDGSGTAVGAVTAEELRGAAEAAKGAGEAEVLIVPQGTEDKSGVSVTLPKEGLEALAESGAGLHLLTPLGEVVLDNAAVRTLAASVNESLSMTVTLENGTTRIALTADGKAAPPVDMLVCLSADQAAPGSVLIRTAADGTEQVVRKCAAVNGMLKARLQNPADLKVENRALRFNDGDGHWAKDALAFVSARGLMIGMGDGEFSPDTGMTRAMFAAVLYRLEDASPAGANPFGDVPEDAWYRDAVTWAANAGIAEGDGSGFVPDAEITREQIAVMLWRYAARLGLDVTAADDLRDFPDADEISGWAREAVGWAVKTGLMQGRKGGTLDPGGSATRAEAATLLQRLIAVLVG